jgi:transcriptional regulator with XRE-family HTH domain
VQDLGAYIKEVANSKGFTTARLAKAINTSRQNMHSIYRRKGIDTLVLHQISLALDHDFFHDLSEGLTHAGLNDPAQPYRRIDQWEKLQKERDLLENMNQLYAYRVQQLEEELQVIREKGLKD